MTFECPHCGAEIHHDSVDWGLPSFECGQMSIVGVVDCDECGATMDVYVYGNLDDTEAWVTSVIEDGDEE